MAITPLIDPQYQSEDYFPIDLSVNNPYWDECDVGNIDVFDAYLQRKRQETGSFVAYGGYLEQRALYRQSARFQEGLVRDTHLGLDLWAPAGTTVHALMDGEIHSFADNNDPGNYGPTLILKHNWRGQPLYSLYGHLSKKDLSSWEVGASFRESDIIAHLGTAEENGGYSPHLHFQVMTDMLEYHGDFPGVAAASELRFYKGLVLDPLHFLFPDHG
ncbi:peptidoglycan DD-metalloendopeptidase family protein [Nonlabens xiamenensis]|uniref:peptidoglycan DD-metalloendopeptidase family protein n=1 Tax=Nonlabens xiamenensis TaxID=2341043 RepID=UPI000F60B773|nr:peptidoglycan DD-metalloendopeptidase family protein [Nonlabens xiamenensis]